MFVLKILICGVPVERVVFPIEMYTPMPAYSDSQIPIKCGKIEISHKVGTYGDIVVPLPIKGSGKEEKC